MHPFSDGDVHATFENLRQKVLQEIDSLENEYLLKASPSELEQHFVEKITINPLVLHTDDQYIESQHGVQIDVSHDFRRAIFPGERAHVPGTHVTIAIPFEGDDWLWRVRPSTFGGGYPEIGLHADRITISTSFPDDSANPAQLKSEIDQRVQRLVETVGNQRRDVEQHNASAPEQIKQRLESKRKKAIDSTNAVSSLGIPMKRRDQPATYTIPTRRRSKPVQRPTVAKEPYTPEPSLSDDEYQHILSVLRSMSLVIERNPESFRTMDEEGIRDHFLLQLNGHYEGGATGETFNRCGKTDILIREGDRNVFIAECKFWRGPKGFGEAIGQLLGYLTWRDCKCAVMIFNRNKDAASVGQKMHEVMQARSEHVKTITHSLDNESRYVFTKPDEPGREITITTQLFNVPAE